MNGVAGIAHCEQSFAPSDLAAQLQPVLDALAHRGEPARWTDRRSTLAAASIPAGPGDSAGTFPRECAGGVIAFHGRLHNRKQLAGETSDELRLPGASDAQFVLAAWTKWGAECLERLLGDFSFVIWDPVAREILAARDPGGLRPLFYAVSEDRFCFSSEVRALLAAPGVSCAVDERMVADFLLWWSDYPELERTFFYGIRRLPPGHWLRWGRGGLRIAPFARIDPQRRIILPRKQDYAGAFQELFREAVRCRMEDAAPTGIFLSGGLDSSSVAAVAARHGAHRVRAFTGKIPHDADESRLAAQVAELCGIGQRIVLAPPASVRAHLESFVARQASPVADIGFVNDNLLIAAARQEGCRTILTGDGADELLGSPMAYLADLLRTGKFIHAHKSMQQLAEFHGRPALEMMRAALLLLAPDFAKQAALRMKWRAAPPWIAPEFARQSGLLEKLRQVRPKIRFPSISATEDYHALVRGRRILMDEARELEAAHFGASFTYPFFDRRLVEFLFAIPWQVRTMGTRSKWFLRDWKDLLPAPVGEIRAKANYTEYWDETVSRSDWNPAALAGNGAAERFLNLAALGPPNQDKPPTSRAGRPLTLWTLSRFLVWLNHYGPAHILHRASTAHSTQERPGEKPQDADGTAASAAARHSAANDKGI